MARPSNKAVLLDRLDRREANVAILGLGYVGLALAAAVARAGHTVLGIDLDKEKVRAVNGGVSHIEDVPSEEVAGLVASGHLKASSEYVDLAQADVIVIAVPTPIDEFRVPDLSMVRAAVVALGAHVKPGALVVLESTTYPGTTEEVVVPELRRRGLRPGLDVFVGYSPERIDPGNQVWRLTNTPKVMAGLTKDCLELVTAFYGGFVESLVPVSSLKTAEITKLFENIFRIVNIALVNEFQSICEAFEIDVWEVIEACSTKPHGYMPFYPGPGLGGHCVPIDPFYLAWRAREKRVNTEFIELAGRINAQMPRLIVGKVAALLNGRRRSLNSARVGLLGVAYKKNTSDVRESPAVRIIELLLEEGAAVTYHDPHVPVLTVGDQEFASHDLLADYLAALDAIIVVADHDEIDWTLVLQYSPLVVDTRNVLGRLTPAVETRTPRRASSWTEADS